MITFKTTLARRPLSLLAQAEELGLDRDELMAVAGLSEGELENPDARVRLPKYWCLWRLLVDRIPDPALGVRLGSECRARDLGLVGYAMLFSPTLGCALGRLARFSHILTETAEVKIVEGRGRRLLEIQADPRVPMLPQLVDDGLSSLVAIIREITERDVTPLEVGLTYPEHGDLDEHRHFFACPLRFDQPSAWIALSPGDLELPLVETDETLGGYLDEHGTEILRSLGPSHPFADRVLDALWHDLSSGQPSTARIAATLGVSPRSLQRRLGKEGTAFRRLVDCFRRGMAQVLLSDPRLAVYEVAFLLGYSEPGSFVRAFRRWEGISPYDFRDQRVT